MASLNSSDKKWLSEEIQRTVAGKVKDQFENDSSVTGKISAAVESFRPNGWRRTGENVKAIGTPAAICSVILAAVALAAAGWYQALSRVKDETRFETNSTRDMGELKSQMVVLRALIASSAPTKPQNQAAAKQLLAESSQKSIPPIPASVVQQSGDSFVSAAIEDPKAWEVALKFASYRSWLNPEVKLSDYSPYDEPHDRFTSKLVPGKQRSRLFAFGAAPIDSDKATAMEELGPGAEPLTLPQPSKVGHSILLVLGGAISVDGMYMRHVVFENVEIHYSGEKGVFQDVTFVNCQFVFDNNANSRTLITRILASQSVTAIVGS
jgi:ABC-type multidrug transport system fused ATPase/permease subunit